MNRAAFLRAMSAIALIGAGEPKNQARDTTEKVEPASFRALVLSGGTAYGAYEAGVLSAVAENKDSKFNVVCGTSIGALNGAMFATGQTEKMSLFWQSIAQRTVLELLPDISHALKSGFGFWTLFHVRRLLRLLGKLLSGDQSSVAESRPAQEILRELFVDASGRIVPFQMPFLWAVTDLEAGCGDYYIARPIGFSALQLPSVQKLAASIGVNVRSAPSDSDDFVERLRSSTAIPGLFEPGKVDGRYYVDGGVVNNTPVNLVRRIGIDQVKSPEKEIEIDVVMFGKTIDRQDRQSLQSAASILVRSYNIMRQRLLDDAIREVATQSLLTEAVRSTQLMGQSTRLLGLDVSSVPRVRLKYISPSRPLVGNAVDFKAQKCINANFNLGINDFNEHGWRDYLIPSDVCSTSSAE